MKWLEGACAVATLLAFIYTLIPDILGENEYGRAIGTAFLVLFLALTFTIHKYTKNSLPTSDGGVQEGTVVISNRGEDEFLVYYPKQYTSAPSLSIQLEEGISAKFEITTQSNDLFRFTARNICYGGNRAVAKWTARGTVSDGST